MCAAAARPTGITKTTTRAYAFERCRACGLVFATPRPTEAELDAFYTADYFSGHSDGLGYGDYRGESWAEANAESMWRSVCRWLTQHVPEESVLDIGCATGAFLAQARQSGWRVQGVEKSAAARAVAASEFGVPVTDSTGAVAAQFGLVTMWHVLEHVLDPLTELVAARDRLAPGGILFIELPQWGSLGRRRRGAGWSQLRPPEHINFFDRRSLAAALGRAGFRLVQAQTVQPDLTNRAIEMIERGRVVRGSAAALAAEAAGRAGLGGYLRCAAAADRD